MLKSKKIGPRAGHCHRWSRAGHHRRLVAQAATANQVQAVAADSVELNITVRAPYNRRYFHMFSLKFVLNV